MDFVKRYLSSFRLESMFLYTLAVDALTWLVIGGMFYWFSVQLRNRLSVLTGGMSPEAFQQYFQSLNAEQTQVFAAQLKGIVPQLVFLFVLLPLIALLMYSFSRSVIWHMLANKFWHENSNSKFNWVWNTLNLLLLLVLLGFLLNLKWNLLNIMLLVVLLLLILLGFLLNWKWNLLNIVMAFIAVGLFLLYIVLKTVIGLVSPSQTIGSVLGFLLVVCFVVLMFLSYHHFTTTRKVFESIGVAFKALKRKEFYVAWAFGALTIFILRFAQYPFRNQLFIYQNAALYAAAVIFLLWLSWFRLYVVGVVR